jgi:hypothetical protein
MNISDLKGKGSITLQYPADLRYGVEEAVRLWQRFCSLPVATKKGLPYSNNSDGVGYECKEGTGPKADRKENFDVTLAGLDWLKQNVNDIENKIALEFVQKAVSLVSLMKPSIMEFARQCENEYRLDGFSDEVEASEVNFFIRFIHYFGDREEGSIREKVTNAGYNGRKIQNSFTKVNDFFRRVLHVDPMYYFDSNNPNFVLSEEGDEYYVDLVNTVDMGRGKIAKVFTDHELSIIEYMDKNGFDPADIHRVSKYIGRLGEIGD